MPSLLDLLPHGPAKYILPSETDTLLRRRVADAERLASALADRLATVENRIAELQFLPAKSSSADETKAADALVLLASSAKPNETKPIEAKPNDTKPIIPTVNTSNRGKRKRHTAVADTNDTAAILRSIATSSSSSSAVYVELAKTIGLQVDPSHPLTLALPFTSDGCLISPVNACFCNAFRAMVSTDGIILLQNDAVRCWFIEAWMAVVSSKACCKTDDRLASAACAFGFFVLVHLNFFSNTNTGTDDRSRIDVLLTAKFTTNAKTDYHLTGGWPARLIDRLDTVPSTYAVKKAQMLLRLIHCVFAPLTASITADVDRPSDAAVVALIGHLSPIRRSDLSRQLKKLQPTTPLAYESARAIDKLPSVIAWSDRSSSAFRNLLGIRTSRTATKILNILSAGLSGSSTVVSICLTAALSGFIRHT